MNLETALKRLPVIAILRGVTPAEAVAVARAVLDAGICAIEVPLNSPDAVSSIARIAQELGDCAAVGAGTVVRADDVPAVSEAGASFVVAPNTDPGVIRACLDGGMDPVPGVATPTEAFAALAAGASYLKLFPAGALGLAYWHALRAVLPADARTVAVGGVDAANAAAWIAAGVAAIGTGSSVYREGRTPQATGAAARELVSAIGG